MQIPAPGAHQCVIGVAIALPSHYAAQVRAVREAAGDPLAEVVPPHITLLPPTAVDLDSLDEVMRHLRNVAAGTNPFEVRLDEVGTFRPVSPVVYLGLRSGAEECDRLQVRVRDRRGPLARSLSFPFHPHVTLAHEVAEDGLDILQAQWGMRRGRIDGVASESDHARSSFPPVDRPGGSLVGAAVGGMCPGRGCEGGGRAEARGVFPA